MARLEIDVAIIGAGIVGLATALEISRRKPSLRIAVLEKESTVAAHQTGHNSGVIHSGIYYKPGSLKAQLCTTGAKEMLDFVRTHEIAHQVCGKLIVATSLEELPRLQMLFERGRANGIPSLREIGPAELTELEPLAKGISALHVPTAAITDYTAVSRKIAELVSSRSADIFLDHAVADIEQVSSQVVVHTSKTEFTAKEVINCAGLFSDRIARLSGTTPRVTIIPFRGEYFSVREPRACEVRGLIYPVPDPDLPFLGVHLTRMIDGRVLAGPNAVLGFKREGYRLTDFSPVDLLGMAVTPGFWKMAARNWRIGVFEMQRSFSRRNFCRSVQVLAPSIADADLTPDGSGVRAQAIEPDGSFVDDFRFQRHGSILHVLNVPSPAATASFAIARVIASQMAATQ